MVKYKNIRVKMRGGKSRLQRVKVLASGKYKFVKNLSRSRKRAGSNPARSKTTRKKNVKKLARRRRYTRKRRGGGGKSATRGIFKLLRLGALVAPGVARAAAQRGDTERMVRAGFLGYAGIDMNNKFNSHVLAECWTPFIVTSALTYLAPKINGLIRRL